MKKVLLLALTILTIGCSKDEKIETIAQIVDGEFIENNQGTFEPVSSSTVYYDGRGREYDESESLSGRLVISSSNISWDYTSSYTETDGSVYTNRDLGAEAVSTLKNRLLVSDDLTVLENNKNKLKVQFDDGKEDGIFTLSRAGNQITFISQVFYDGDLESETKLIIRKK